MSMKPLGADALRILDVVSSKASTGFALMSQTGMDEQKFREAVIELRESDLIEVKGGLGEGVGDAYFYVPPVAKMRSQAFRNFR